MPTSASASTTSAILRGLVFALLCGVLATPLVTAAGALFPVQTGKAFAARVLIEVAAFLYFWLALRDPRYRPRGGALAWAIAAYCAAALLATASGVNPYRSFFGNLERMNGVAGLLHAALLFAIARGILRTTTQWLRVFEVSLAVSAIAAALAVAEGLRIAGTPMPRPSSTLGHPDFLATYALFHVFFAAFVLLLERNRALRWLAGLALALNVAALALAASRGAWVGIYAALMVGAGALALSPAAGARRRTAGAAALALLIALPLAIRALHGTALEPAMPHVVQRLAGSSLSDPSIRTRLRSVPMSAAAVAERPALGWGPENFRTAFDRHYVADEPALEQWFDHAHNKLADVAVETGLLGTLAYLAMFAAAGTALLRYTRRAQESAERLVGAAAMLLGIAYFVQNLFLFDTPVSQLLFFLLLAFVAFLADPREGIGAEANGAVGGSARVALVAAAALTLAAIVWGNVLPFRSAVLGRTAIAAQTPGEALAAYRQAMAHAGFARAEVTRAFEDEFIDRGRARSPEWTPVFDELRKEVEAMLAAEPTDVRAFMRAANLYNERSTLDPRLLADAERMSRSGIALSPSRPDAYYELGVTHLKARDYGRARDVFRRVAAVNDGIAWARWGNALALLGAGARAEGLAELDRALAMGADWDVQPEVYVLTHAFVTAQPAAGLVPLYERVVAARPGVARYRVMLATAYADAGDPGRAKEQAVAAVALDPSYAADARRFVEGLRRE